MFKVIFSNKINREYANWNKIRSDFENNPTKIKKYFESEENFKKYFYKINSSFEDFYLTEKINKKFLKNNSKKNKIVNWAENEIKLFLKNKQAKVFLNKVQKFWGTNIKNKEINIIICPQEKKYLLNWHGASFAGKENKILFLFYKKEKNIFNQKTFLSILTHEFSHLIQFCDNNNLKKICNQEYQERKLNNKNKKIFYYKNILESINSSISHYNLGLFLKNYFKITDLRMTKQDKKIFLEENLKNKSKSFWQIFVAYKLLPLTEKYFQENKQIDKYYLKKVFDYWEEVAEKIDWSANNKR